MLYERFAVLGLATGALYALTALGIVIVHRSSGVLNFAAGGIGAAAAYVTYELRDSFAWAGWLAALVGLCVGAALGLVSHLVVMVLLRQATPLSKLIATLGILTILQGGISLIWGAANKGQPASLLPTSLVHPVSGMTIPQDRLWLIAISLAAAAMLKILYTRTTFGLHTAAVAENSQVAAIAGVSATKVEMINYAMAGAISAAAAILIAPVIGLQVAALVLIVIPALAGALTGNFSSFGVTVVASLAIGVMQAEIPLLPFLQDRPALTGLPEAVPVLLIVLVATLRGRGRLERGESTTKLPAPGSGRLSPVLLGGAVAVGLALTVTASPNWVGPVTVTLAIGVLVLSVVVVTGYAGQLSLAQFAIAGLGLWGAARLYSTAHWPFPFAAAGGVGLAIAAGVLVALPALRTRGVTLAVATLGLAITIEALVLRNVPLTGGFGGTAVGGATIAGWRIDPVDHPNRYASLALVGLVAAGIVVTNIRRARIGLRLLAVRSNERAAAALGINVLGAKLYAFAVAAAVAGLAGILLGFRDRNVQFAQFQVYGSIAAVQLAVIGGIGWGSGALLGATLATGAVVSELLNHVAGGETVQQILVVGSGVVVIAILAIAPDGVAARVAAALRRVRTSIAQPLPRAAVENGPAPRFDRSTEHVALHLDRIDVRFGGVTALSRVSLHVRPGEVVGLIGPNGAGKTTLLDVISGFTKPTSGEIRLGEATINSWSVERRARAGIGRSFQAVELFEDMTVGDNLRVAADPQRLMPYATDLLMPKRPAETDALRWIAEHLGLSGLLACRPAELSQGQARLVGIARAMCTEPAVLLLDEPAAGLDAEERTELGESIRALATRTGVGVVLVEHDVPLVMAVCDRIVALDFGKVIADGPPAEVSQDAAVVSSYLGEGATR